jgi:predicted RNase H-like HicB family nuclease
MTQLYDMLIQYHDDYVMAYHPTLPGCKAHGDDAQEAYDALQDARSDYLDVMRGDGLHMPEPDRRSVVITFDWIVEAGR